MTPERIAEIKETLATVRNFGHMPHEALKAIDEMMAVCERVPDLDYALNVNATWKEEKRKIRELKHAGALLWNAMTIMRCCADLCESPTKDECELMGKAMKAWDSIKECS